MRGTRRAATERGLAPCASALAILLLLSCDGGSGGSSGTPDAGGTGDGARREVAASLAEHVILPTYREFAQAAATLEAAAAAYAGSMAEADRTAAREAWTAAMEAWQRAEVMQVGPAGSMAHVAGGEDLRDVIYSWPIVNRCRVDQVTAAGGYESAETLSGQAVNARGLDAMEYLLFVEDAENRCPPNLPINAEGQWAGLGEDEIAARRAAYASSAATLVHRDASDLVGRWEGGFLEQVRTAGAGSDVYPTAQTALNAISDAMFYLDTETKDMKLADPAGISDECLELVCPDLRESPFANRSKEHIVGNLEGFRMLVSGASTEGALGFDDLLTEIGAGELAQGLVADIDAAIAAVEAVPGPLAEAVTNDREAVVAAHAAVKAVTDRFKSELFTILDFMPPRGMNVDND